MVNRLIAIRHQADWRRPFEDECQPPLMFATALLLAQHFAAMTAVGDDMPTRIDMAWPLLAARADRDCCIRIDRSPVRAVILVLDVTVAFQAIAQVAHSWAFVAMWTDPIKAAARWLLINVQCFRASTRDFVSDAVQPVAFDDPVAFDECANGSSADGHWYVERNKVMADVRLVGRIQLFHDATHEIGHARQAISR